MGRIVGRIDLDKIRALRGRKHSDYVLTLNSGIVVIVEETGRVASEDFSRIGETLKAIREGLIALEGNVKGFVGVVHKAKRLRNVLVKAMIAEQKRLRLRLKAVSCRRELRQLIKSL